MSVNIPLTGVGGTTATVAAEAIGGEQYQYMKLTGASASTVAAGVAATTPAGTDGALLVRPIASTAFTQASALTAGSSATSQYFQCIGYSSGAFTRTTVNTSADASVIAANTSRKGLIIANLTTAQTIALGFSTAAVTTAAGNVSMYLAAQQQAVFGFPGNLPLYLGAIRGITITSTTVSGGVAVSEFQ